MEVAGVIIPLNKTTIVAVMEQTEARVVHKFLKERLEINDQVADKLVTSVKSGTFATSWYDLTIQMKAPLDGFFEKTDPTPSFIGVVPLNRVLRAAIAWMKISISEGVGTILNGSKELSEENISYFRDEKTHNWELDDPDEMSPTELELGMRKSQERIREKNLGHVEERMEGSLKKMAKLVVGDLEEKGLLKEKCGLCRRSFHKVTEGPQEKNCPLFKPDEVCLKCGSLAQKGCFGGIKGAECRETKLCQKEECKNFPEHYPRIHDVSGVAKDKIKSFYGGSFCIREKRPNSGDNTPVANKRGRGGRGNHMVPPNFGYQTGQGYQMGPQYMGAQNLQGHRGGHGGWW